jgi:late competence protein required for DNA uptake (superfamily II DNA/RNA helicase)
MVAMASANKSNESMICNRCGGRMISEKFYDLSSIFYGWHCVICGEILDPVILLHRLSQNAELQIPEGEENVMYLLRQYLQTKSKKFDDAKV